MGLETFFLTIAEKKGKNVELIQRLKRQYQYDDKAWSIRITMEIIYMTTQTNDELRDIRIDDG